MSLRSLILGKGFGLSKRIIKEVNNQPQFNGINHSHLSSTIVKKTLEKGSYSGLINNYSCCTSGEQIARINRLTGRITYYDLQGDFLGDSI